MFKKDSKRVIVDREHNKNRWIFGTIKDEKHQEKSVESKEEQSDYEPVFPPDFYAHIPEKTAFDEGFREHKEDRMAHFVGVIACNQIDVEEFKSVPVKDDIIEVSFTPESKVYGVKGREPVELCCVYIRRNDYLPGFRYDVVYAVPQKLYDMFKSIDFFDGPIPNELKHFFEISEPQREYIFNACMMPKFEGKPDSARVVTTDETELNTMYKLLRDVLPPHIEAKCRELVNKRTFSNKIKGDNMQILSDILHTCVPIKSTPELPCVDECIAILDKYRYGDRELKEAIAQRIRLLARGQTRGTVIALLGEPGVGKTSLGRGIAECLKKTFCFIDCKDRELMSIGGSARTYEGAQHGEIMDVLVHYGNDCCIMLDEYEKMHSSAEKGDPFGLFIPAWDDRKEFTDLYTNVPVPVDNVCWILTFNSMKTVPEFIKNRFAGNIFTIDGYDVKKKVEICKRFVYPDLKAKYHFTDDEILFCDDGFYAAAELSDDAGARVSAKNIEKVLGVANVRLERGQKGPIVIDREFVKLALTEAKGNHEQRVIGFSTSAVNKKEVG